METLICDLFMDTEGTMQALRHLAGFQKAIVQRAVSAGLGVTLFESSVTPPLVPPSTFNEQLSPLLADILEGSQNQLIIGGDTLPIMEGLVSVAAQNVICPVETDQGPFLAAMGGRLETRVNMSPSVFLAGQRSAALAEAERVRDLCTQHANCFPGVLLPGNADADSVLAVKELFAATEPVG